MLLELPDQNASLLEGGWLFEYEHVAPDNEDLAEDPSHEGMWIYIRAKNMHEPLTMV